MIRFFPPVHLACFANFACDLFKYHPILKVVLGERMCAVRIADTSSAASYNCSFAV